MQTNRFFYCLERNKKDVIRYLYTKLIISLFISYFFFKLEPILVLYRLFHTFYMDYTVETTTLSPGRIHAFPMRDRTVIAPWSYRVDAVSNLYDLLVQHMKFKKQYTARTRHGHDTITLRTDTNPPGLKVVIFTVNNSF